ncbi:MAG: class I SAM-dependent methyltransferase [Bryobacterales bacterium]|nr:class I SAM-dependent methyltransferase [Bryobacterales bacterium]
MHCAQCGSDYPVVLGIPDLRVFPDPYIDIESDWAKGLKVGAKLDSLTFEELLDFYYSITSVVPPIHARQYKAGLMAGVSRSAAALDWWQRADGSGRSGSLLDVGCGTAPLLVAAAPRFRLVAGVDISFRWLVVARKRLADAGLDVPLICACAEALPFPEPAFDRVAVEFALENFKDQRQAALECARVLNPGGRLWISTPNRFSPGPDPHVGLWGGSLLPDRWIAAYARRIGANAPQRRLLSAASLKRLVVAAAFDPPVIDVPPVTEQQLARFGPHVRAAVRAYQAALRAPLCGPALRCVAPILHAVARKTAARSGERQPQVLLSQGKP